MTHRVFLDVGSHVGQTLDEVVKPEHDFALVWAFEPMQRQYDELVARFAHMDGWRLKICKFGLADVTGQQTLYGSNDAMEASLYPDKLDVDESQQADCDFIEASEFFRLHLVAEDTNIMKLNCEGAEAAILDNLMDSGEIWKLHNVVVDFDVRKIPSMSHREREVIARMDEIGFNRYSLHTDVWIGDTHQDRISNWLRGLR